MFPGVLNFFEMFEIKTYFLLIKKFNNQLKQSFTANDTIRFARCH